MSRLLLLGLLIALAGCNLATSESATPTAALPQADLTCNQIVASALQAVSPACDSTGRNQACYGNRLVEAQFQEGIQATFDNVGDLAQIQGLRFISTAPLDENTQNWGIALLKAQANLPDTLPGQNVTFLFYGGATVNSISPAMEAVVISTGFGGTNCEAAPPAAVLIQSPDGTQATMNINGATVTLGSTLHITAVNNGVLTIATVNGTAIVEAFGTTRNVGPGAQVTMPLGGLQIIGQPSEPQPYDLNAISRAPFSLLDQQVQIPPPIAPAATPELSGLPVTSTLPPITIPLPPTAIPTACTPRADWTSIYTIQSGDTLFSIASQFGISLAELQSGNCIADANIIAAGQPLRVPAPPAIAIPTATPTDVPILSTSTPTAADFRADESTIILGECTTIRWDVDNIDSVYFEGQGTTGHGQQDICPKQSTRYTLLVIHPNGDQIPYFVSVTVENVTA